MSSVIARRIRSAPYRPAAETWRIISNLLGQGDSSVMSELNGVTGIAASTIVDQITKDSPIVAIGKGPRIRVYCLYGDDATTGEDANEDSLPVMPLQGDWQIHIPFVADELEWAHVALKQKTSRILAYDAKAGLAKSASDEEETSSATSTTFVDLSALDSL